MEEEKKTLAESQEKIDKCKGWAGILPGKVLFAVPPVYKDAYPDQPNKWPVFKFAPANGLDFNDDLDNPDLYKVREGRVLLESGAFRKNNLRRGLLDWKNRPDAHGDMIPCEKGPDGRLSDAAIASMPSVLQDWCLNVISSVAMVTKEESDGLKF